MVLAVLEARCGVTLAGRDVYLNVAGGLRIYEPAADLAVAAALISSVADVPLPEETVVFGEIGLSGDVRIVSQADLRLKEAAKLGFTRAIVPAGLKHRTRPLDITEISQLDDLALRLTVGERGLARADA